MQVKWVETIPGGPKGLGYVHTNRQYYPDMTVKSFVGNRASYRRHQPSQDAEEGGGAEKLQIPN